VLVRARKRRKSRDKNS